MEQGAVEQDAEARRAVGRIGFIGAGRLAASLAAGLSAAGYEVGAIASRHGESARALAGAVDGAVAVADAQAVLDDSELVFLAVPDDHITGLTAGLRWRAGLAAVHCSGALGLIVLAPAARAGALTGCLHPLQSFPVRAPQPGRFRGVSCGVEGAGVLGDRLERMARDLGAAVIRLAGVDRAAYHAAAVLASNDVVALLAAARRAWVLAGLPAEAARPALAPLLLAVAEQLADEELAAEELASALTGPIARGDVATVTGHLAALEAEPSLRALYALLAEELLRLELGHPAELRERLQSLLAT